MRKQLIAGWVGALLLTTAATAEAQRATITAAQTSGTEDETLVFTVDADWRYSAEVEYQVVDGTATEGTDYQGSSGALCALKNDAHYSDACVQGGNLTPYDVEVFHYREWPNIKDDNETYRVEAWIRRYETGATDANGMAVVRECSGANGCGKVSITAQIRDPEPEPNLDNAGHVEFTTDHVTIEEGRSTTATLRFTPSSSPHRAASVRYATSTNATATPGDDFTPVSGTFNIRACTSTSSCPTQERSIRLQTRQDRVWEEYDEEFSLDLTPPQPGDGWLLGPKAFFLVTIRDDDRPNEPPTVSITASETSVAAGGTATLTAVASDPDGSIALYRWTGSGTFTDARAMSTTWTAPRPSATTTYAPAVTVTDNDGQTARATASIEVRADTTTTANVAGEVFFFPGHAAEVAEGESATATIRFLPATTTHRAGSVRWRTQPGSASTADYTSASGTFRISACSTAPCGTQDHAITIRTRDDNTHESSAEDFTIELDSPSAVAITSPTFTVTISGPNDEPVDDRPRVNIGGGTVDEGRSVTLQVTVQPAGRSGSSVKYRIGTADERAHTSGRDTGECRDYQYREGTLGLSGRTSASITVRALADGCTDEHEESVSVLLYDPVGVTLEKNSGSVAIHNVSSTVRFTTPRTDEFQQEIRVSEGRSATLRLQRDVQHPGARVPASVEVHLEALEGAQEGVDFEAGPKTVAFNAGQATRTVSFRVFHDDEHDEEGEAFRARLVNPVGVKANTNTDTIRIEDPDGPSPRIDVSIRAVTGSVDEGETAVCEISVAEREGRRLDANLRVRWYTSSLVDAATAGSDYEASEGWLTFDRRGRQSQQVRVTTYRTQANHNRRYFDCNIGDDASDEADYEYTGSYEVTPGPASATVNISNINVDEQDRTGSTRGPIWDYDAEATEQSRTVRIEMNLNGELPDVLNGTGKEPLVVSWTTATDGQATALAGQDYTARSGTYTFRVGGPTSFTVSIPISCDSTREDDETFYVRATGARQDNSAVGGTSQVTVTIRSEYGRCGRTPRLISIADSTAVEGEDVTFTVSTTRTFDTPITNDYATRFSSASPGRDYVESTGTVTIPANQSSATFTVATLRDNERDENERFIVTLSNAATNGVRLEYERATASGFITEEDPIASNWYFVPRTHNGKTPFSMTLDLSADLAFAPGTTRAQAAAKVAEAMTGNQDEHAYSVEIQGSNNDYSAWRFTVTPANSPSNPHITIGIDHTKLSGADGRPLAPIETVTIEGPPTVSIADAEAFETNDRSDGVQQTMKFTVSMNAAATNDISVDYATSEDTDGDHPASSGRDYEAKSGTLRIAKGYTSGTITIKIYRTTEAEENETFLVTLSNLRGHAILEDDPVATGTIKDNAQGATFTGPATPRTDSGAFLVKLELQPPLAAVDGDILNDLRQALRTEHFGSGGHVTSVVNSPSSSLSNFDVRVTPNTENHVRIYLPIGAAIADRYMQYEASVLVPGPVRVSLSSAQVTEGATETLAVPVRLNQPPPEGRTVTLDYETIEWTGTNPATEGDDYTDVSGSLTFNSTETRKDVSVPILDDTVKDEPDERFQVEISNVQGATVPRYNRKLWIGA